MRVVLHALNGRRMYVQNLTHEGSMHDFREMVEWLKSMPNLSGMWSASGGSVPIVRFDSGGRVLFVSSPHHLDGYDANQIVEDEFLR